MINERVEVRDYLQGKNLHRDIEYRICLLLAKWYYEQGNTTVPAIREKLKIWAKDNNFYFNVSMNTIANRVIDGQMKLQGDFPIYISRADIDIIQKHFDSYYERIVALAVLCYSKAYAKDNKFKISQIALEHWLNINHRTLSKYFKMLEQFNYIGKVQGGDIHSWYNKYVVAESYTYEILVPCENTGDYQLIDNNIFDLYDIIFNGIDLHNEEWYPVEGYNDWYEISSAGRVRAKEREIDGRIFPAKILLQQNMKTAKSKYVYLFDEQDKKQKLVAVNKLKKYCS